LSLSPQPLSMSKTTSPRCNFPRDRFDDIPVPQDKFAPGFTRRQVWLSTNRFEGNTPARTGTPSNWLVLDGQLGGGVK
jgi:hypothetical protein